MAESNAVAISPFPPEEVAIRNEFGRERESVTNGKFVFGQLIIIDFMISHHLKV